MAQTHIEKKIKEICNRPIQIEYEEVEPFKCNIKIICERPIQEDIVDKVNEWLADNIFGNENNSHIRASYNPLVRKHLEIGELYLNYGNAYKYEVLVYLGEDKFLDCHNNTVQRPGTKNQKYLYEKITKDNLYSFYDLYGVPLWKQHLQKRMF